MGFVDKLVEALIPLKPQLDPEARAQAVFEAQAYVGRSISLAPFHVRLALSVLTLSLRAWLVCLCPLWGRRPGGPAFERAVGWFQGLPGPFANAVRLYRSLTMMAYLEQPDVARKLIVGAPIKVSP